MDNERSTAIILLTGYLPGVKSKVKPLSNLEWNKLAVWLNNKGLKPEDLLTHNVGDILNDWIDNKIPFERINLLLQRGGALAILTDKWKRSGIWVLNRSDKDYPMQLKNILKSSAPPILYGIGNKNILNTKSVAVVGSRNTSDQDFNFSQGLGKKISDAGYSVVSGGAKGVDEYSMLGALENNGTCIGILADSLLRKATSKIYREHIMKKNLVLISPYNPEARFNVGTAMGRNKFIYVLSEAAVVVHSGLKGGTWNGALENLKNKWVPTWIKPNNDSEAGNSELIKKGGNSLHQTLEDIDINQIVNIKNEKYQQTDLFKQDIEESKSKQSETVEKISEENIDNSLFDLFLKSLESQFKKEFTLDEIVTKINIIPEQGKTWVEQAILNGKIKKISDKSYSINQ